MNFLQRLMRYLIGVGIGLVLVYMFFGQRSCDGWTPENRVKTLIMDAEMKMTPDMACRLDCQGLTATDLLNLVNGGDVDFANSKVKKEPKVYVINSTSNKLENVSFEVVGDSIVWLIGIAPEKLTCPCP